MDVKKKEMDLLSNSMAAYAHIKGNPESFGLYFVLGVCFGLVLTLCLLVMRISCKPRGRTAGAAASSAPEKKIPRDEEERESAGEDVDDVDDVEVAPSPPLAVTTEIPAGNGSIGDRSDGTPNVFASAEELERAQRLEERERIIREIWRNGQPDVLGTGTGTVGRVRYY
ncbi:eva-1 homolog Ba [Hippocampus comes]|uniref:Eva-1 homolog Ba (C. elegans) n=1 Tax=Hippocampus comes TaxID=109280 RepID=A0A3Q2YQS7_HIPCM|nr:PREDICTED: protein eva-1 homolog B [Hippocampus comes]XP_019720869.1 PREDICTED: protein eva-1 homolog B [Hippocampus comes]XP_019720870.1 PREDICTED: protein eva-1 homolog B [Hippocampus comes]